MEANLQNNCCTFRTRSSDVTVQLPLFIPVYRPDYPFVLFDKSYFDYGLSAVMVNAFLMYKDTSLRKAFSEGYTLRQHLDGFPGMLCTDSGAFQQLGGKKVNLDPNGIVLFQNQIQTDIAAPLDLITPPETNFEETKQRMIVSHYRIEQALGISEYSDIVGLQQGGGFFSLRQEHIRQLAKIGFSYYGIGSMVPFFSKNHNILFTCAVIKDARSVIGAGKPLHVYGAGDPLDMAFMFYAGANIFDSSSYAHYANSGFYMTPYGAVKKPAELRKLGFECDCPVCASQPINDLFSAKDNHKYLQQHNLYTLLRTVKVLEKKSGEGVLESYVSSLVDKHTDNIEMFPNSRLGDSWESYLAGKISVDANRTPPPPVSVPVKAERSPKENVSELEAELLTALAEDITKTYKLDAEKAEQLAVRELTLPKYVKMRQDFRKYSTVKDIQRLRSYKDFRTALRGAVYHYLRQYKTSDFDFEALLAQFISTPSDACAPLIDELLEKHVSTKERLPDKAQFTTLLSQFDFTRKTVIDVGCGFDPLLLGADFFKSVGKYIAVDNDTKAVEIVSAYAEKFGIANLSAYCWDIDDGVEKLAELTGEESYDFALVLKVLPVLYRAPKTAAVLVGAVASLPAREMLITACQSSMTKYKSIEQREDAALKRFIRDNGFEIKSEFKCGVEFGYLISAENTAD